jgi:serine/threonine protein kinase
MWCGCSMVMCCPAGHSLPGVFEYVEGADVADMIQQHLLAPEDALELGKQVIEGLVHLHAQGFHHCDIKPRNLLWTQKGAKIIDFNVSVRADDRTHAAAARAATCPRILTRRSSRTTASAPIAICMRWA